MKKIFIYMMAALAVTGCSDMLEEEPKSIAAEVFYNTPSEAEAAVNAIYGPMRTDNAFGINYP
ncbi:MAG TPA: hypothetical protein VJ184_12020, partial [Chryseolinea sp.]|nr:hypothetical protein [Chryseolinea sp.]